MIDATAAVNLRQQTQGELLEAVKMLTSCIDGFPDLLDEPGISTCYHKARALLDQVEAELNRAPKASSAHKPYVSLTAAQLRVIEFIGEQARGGPVGREHCGSSHTFQSLKARGYIRAATLEEASDRGHQFVLTDKAETILSTIECLRRIGVGKGA